MATCRRTAYKLVESDILALLALENAIEAEAIGRILAEKLATELVDDFRCLRAVPQVVWGSQELVSGLSDLCQLLAKG